jgi:hypothetical protein
LATFFLTGLAAFFFTGAAAFFLPEAAAFFYTAFIVEVFMQAQPLSFWQQAS